MSVFEVQNMAHFSNDGSNFKTFILSQSGDTSKYYYSAKDINKTKQEIKRQNYPYLFFRVSRSSTTSNYMTQL